MCPVFSWDTSGAGFLHPDATLGTINAGVHTLCFPGTYLGLDFSVLVPPRGSCLVFFWDIFGAGFLSPTATMGLVPYLYSGSVLGWVSPSQCCHGTCALSLPGIGFGLDFFIPVLPRGSCPLFTWDVFGAGFLGAGATLGLVPCVYPGCVLGWTSPISHTAGTTPSPPGAAHAGPKHCTH